MNTRDVKPDLSLLKRGISSMTDNQPENKLRRTDNPPEESVEEVNGSGSYFSLESKKLVHCIFPKCTVMCLSQEAMERHFNMRHATVKINRKEPTTRDVNDYLVFPSKTQKPQEKKSNKSNKDVPCNIPCMVPNCRNIFQTWEQLYSHRLHAHGLSPPPDKFETFGAIKTISCLDPDCSKDFIDQEDMENHFEEAHYEPKTSTNSKIHEPIVFTNNVEVPHTKFQCPVPFCKSRTKSYKTLLKLEDHCLGCHRGHTFPWCSPDKNIKCLIPGCSRKFNRQTGLEAHMMAKHGGKNAHLPSSSPPRSTISATTSSSSTSAAKPSSENQQFFNCTFNNCLFSTSDLAFFNYHQRLHTGDLPHFRCNVPNCGVFFNDEEVMIDHQKVIHGIQPVKPAY